MRDQGLTEFLGKKWSSQIQLWLFVSLSAFVANGLFLFPVWAQEEGEASLLTYSSA